MLDRPDPGTAIAPPIARWPSALLCAAGLLGAAGVGVGAAGAHLGGGDLTRTASDFALVHAAALVAGSAAAGRAGRAFAVGMALIAAGAALFCGELALAGLFDWRPVPVAAPVGGLGLIAGWLTVAGAGVASAVRRR